MAMNNSQNNTSKAIALFLSLGLMSSLVGCNTANPGGSDEGEDVGAPTEQPVDQQDEDGDDDQNEPAEQQDEGDEGGEGGEDG
jgi:hypothetical protein